MNTSTNDLSTTEKEKDIFIMHQKYGEDTAYNITLTVEIEGEVNYEKLNMSISDYTNRHKELRTRYIIKNGSIVKDIVTDFKLGLIHKKILPGETLDRIDKLLAPFMQRQAGVAKLIDNSFLDRANKKTYLTRYNSRRNHLAAK